MTSHPGVGMSHHLTDDLKGYTISNGHSGRESEPGCMGTDILIDSAEFGYFF